MHDPTEPYRGVPHVEVWRLDHAARISVAREPAPGPAAQGTPVAQEWSRQVRLNPRLFNGPILAVISFDPAAGHVHARRESYQRLVVQPRVPTGVRQLSVTGLLTAADAAGRAHVLLGRRAPGVRIYGGQWELGPSGGLSAPPMTVTEIAGEGLRAQLADEIAEEIGLDTPTAAPVAYARDLLAHSDDLCLRADLGPLEPVARVRPANWEYTEVAWVPLADLPSFDAAHAGEIIPPTRALWRVLGWVPA